MASLQEIFERSPPIGNPYWAVFVYLEPVCLDMEPIHRLLARIRWDAEFSQGVFEIGYWDRVAHRILRIGLCEIARDPDNPSLFDIVDEEGIRRSIPFHRIRQAWRNGRIIWTREKTASKPAD